ncbi:hypothetical protein FPV67DRAFT_1667585 [Lyophyllum atratum]|nr:hypothetical protein FPV67DRAFT_1667585 [Lyophyllum atratum]
MSGGSVTISAVAVLENCRALDPQAKPNSLSFDAHLFFSDTCQALASLRYFNSKKLTFDAGGLDFCFVTANVAQVPPRIATEAIASEGLALNDYSLVGDIVSLIKATNEIDVHHSPYITIAGIVDRSSDSDHSFDIRPEPWTSHLKDAPGSKASFPTFCQFPKWKDKARIPQPGAYVAVGGFLTGLKTDGSKTFVVEIEKVTFMGRTPITPKVESPLGSQSTTPTKGNLKFGYGNPSPSPSPTKRQRTTEPNAEASSSSAAPPNLP